MVSQLPSHTAAPYTVTKENPPPDRKTERAGEGERGREGAENREGELQ